MTNVNNAKLRKSQWPRETENIAANVTNDGGDRLIPKQNPMERDERGA